MKKPLLTLLLTTAACLAAAPGNAQTTSQPQLQAQTETNPKTTMNKEQKEVLHAIIVMTEAFHNGDIEGVMASYAPEATVVFDRQTPVSGHDAIREKFMGAFAIKPRFEFAGHEVFIAGDTALHIAPWVMSATLPDGKQIQDSGLSVATLKRQKDGRWLMVIDNPHGSFLQK